MKLNISIDDISPHPLSSVKVLDRCYELIEEFPDIKFSLFIPLAYWRTGRPGTTTKRPMFVSEHLDFCMTMRELPSKNFELGYHGYFHGKPRERSDNNELDGINYEDAKFILNQMIEEADKAGIKDLFKPMLRPPNWKMCPEAFDAATDRDWET